MSVSLSSPDGGLQDNTHIHFFKNDVTRWITIYSTIYTILGLTLNEQFATTKLTFTN